MGLVTAEISLDNPVRPERMLTVKCLADTGALYLCIPDHIAIQLGFDPGAPEQTKEVTTADGRSHMCPYVGPIRIRFKNRTAYVGALILGEDVLLGAIPMEDLDVVIVPSQLTIDVNPANPFVAAGPAKGAALDDLPLDLKSHYSLGHGASSPR